MKILLYSPLYGSGYGTGYASQKESEYLSGANTITVIHSEKNIDKYKIKGINYIFSKNSNGKSFIPLWDYLKVSMSVNGAIQKAKKITKYDVIYNQSFFLGLANKRRLGNTPIVTFVRSTIRGIERADQEVPLVDKLKRSLAFFIIKQLETRTYKLSRFLIVKSNIMKNELISLYAIRSEKIHVIPGGIDSDFSNLDYKNIDAKNQSKTIAYIGRIEPVKGILRMLSLIQRASTEGCTVKFAGTFKSKFYKRKVINFIKDNLASNKVEFLGFLNIEDVKQLIQNSDLVIALSWYEPFGMIAAQVAALGKPIIVSEYLGANESLSQYQGLYIAKDDKDAVKYINEIITNRSQEIENYLIPCWEKVCYQIQQILTEATT